METNIQKITPQAGEQGASNKNHCDQEYSIWNDAQMMCRLLPCFKSESGRNAAISAIIDMLIRAISRRYGL